jgi:iron complex transport system ATP-binding protein
MNILELSRVSVPHRLEDVSAQLPSGMLAGLIGPNGAGKSTLLQVAGGLLPARGEVKWKGRSVRDIPIFERGRLAAWVPQEAFFEFGFAVRDVVAQGRFAHGDDARGVDDILVQLDLANLAARPVNRLSGGERHRVLLGRALATDADLHLWDEPLAQLDPKHALEVLVIAQTLSRAGKTILFSLHDLRVAHCLDYVLVMHEGRLRAAGKPNEVLTPELLLDVFGIKARIGESLLMELPHRPNSTA